jgi:3-oxoacyl-[acyl-carrier-protein] synthase-3
MNSIIVATGSYLPERVVPNEAFEQFPKSAIPLIEEKTGVRCRRYARDDQSTSDLAIEAARRCLEKAGADPGGIDALILATSSPDRIQPATATRVQEGIGARRAFAFDLNSVCTGALYALQVADAFVRTETCRQVLVVASEVYSRYLNPKDFSTCPYFGDGAGAVLLAPSKVDRGIVRTLLRSDGAGHDVIQIPAGGTMMPFAQMARPQDAFFKMRGREVYDFAVERGSEVVRELLEATGMAAGEVGFVVPHQANANVLREIAERLSIDFAKFVVNLDRYGNMAAASVLVALDELLGSGRVRTGDAIVLVAFGGGLSWGATLIRH